MVNENNLQPRRDWKVDKHILILLNQLYEIERKTGDLKEFEKIKRNIERMKDVFRSEIYKDAKVFYEDPMGQPYDETRSDLEANIAGETTEELFVVDVIKPIIRASINHQSSVVQKGIVTVEAQKTEKEVSND